MASPASSSSLAFLPRNVSKQKPVNKKTSAIRDEVPVASGSRSSGSIPTLEQTVQAATPASSEIVEKVDRRTESEQKKITLKDEDCSRLLELSLSDYVLWSNFNLQERIFSFEDGFVPINYLFQHSPLLAGMTRHPPESTLVRCIKASPTLEARMILTEPSPEASIIREEKGRLDAESGGFAVRRKDWELLRDRIRRYTTFQWENKSVYIENLPQSARTVPAVQRFIEELLNEDGNKDARLSQLNAIQAIIFPAHHADRPDAPPPAKSKGFAFLVLSQRDDAERLLHRWPWSLEDRPVHADTGALGAVNDAFETGFRCLPKSKWNELKEEYLSLQRRLLMRAAGQADESSLSISRAVEVNAETPSASQEPKYKGHAVVHKEGPSEIPDLSSYPKDCLVHIRHVYSETNKTTLRSLFSHALAYETDGADTAIDYVDYTKGLDNCYLRFATPHYARALVSHLTSHLLAQIDALDNVGSSTEANSPTCIRAELVHGKKEELYWEKVPEKVRKQAMAKTHARTAAVTSDVAAESVKREPEDGAGKKRKRRKRG